MSESPRQRIWHFYIHDMLQFAEKVALYTQGYDQPRFSQRDITYDATLRNLELIGEAASHIPQDIRDAEPQIPWRRIVATRNRLVHGYLGIDDDTLWSVITSDLPELVKNLRTLAQKYGI